MTKAETAEPSVNSADDAAANAASEAPKPVEIASRQAYPDGVTIAKLANGLTIIVQENHTAPVATVHCAVKNTGSMYENKYLGAGLSHVLEHVVSGGTTSKRTEDEINKLVDSFGGISNAYTSLDVTAYYIDCPARNVETCIDIIADTMQHITFEEKEFNREMRVVQQELADGLENRGRVMWKLMQELIYQESFARIPVIGYLDVLRQVKREQIIDFYHERYVPNNQIFVVVGDVNTDKVLAQVAEAWAGTPRGFETTACIQPQEPAQLAPREVTHEMDGKTTDVALVFPTVKLQDDDMYALDLLSYILSTGDSSRMVRDMQYDRGLVLSVSTSSFTPTFANGFFAVRVSVEPEKEAEAVEAALKHLYDTRETLVTEKELAKAKKQKAAELIFGRQTVQQQAEGLIQSYTGTGIPNYDEVYVTNLQKVTAEQIQAVARKYFQPDRLNTIRIRPKTDKTQDTAEAEKQTKGDTTLTTLDNGLKVLIKRVTNLPLAEVKLYWIGGNLLDTRETAGRASLLSSMLDKGTATRSAEEISEYFDSIGGLIGFDSGRYTFSGSVFVLKEDLPQATEILADCLKNPAFPEEKFQQIKQLTLGAIASRKGSPQAELMELFADNLPETTKYGIVLGGKQETIEPLTAEALKAHYLSTLVPKHMVLAIYGDVDEAEALALAKKHFGDIPEAPNAAEAKPITAEMFDFSNALPEPVVKHKTTQKEAGMVLIAYPAPSIFNKEEFAAMKVLNAIMAGCGFPGGWLHEELRGEGRVYSVHGLMLTGSAPGYYMMVAQTSPDKVDEVVSRLRKNVEKAKAGQFTEEEFRIAKEMLIAMHAQTGTTIGDLASTQALDELYGFGYDDDKNFDARYEAVTMEQVKAVAKKYLSQNSIQVTTSNK